MTRALIVSAPASGSGKTLLTLGLLRHFRNAGMPVCAFKVGPDYIDPAFHQAASDRPCRNLDPWAMRPETLAQNLAAVSEDAELVIGEGVMGLFDGATDGSGSTADLALLLGLPVLLLVDVRGQAASVAATVQGFRDYRPEVDVAGVVCNRVGGAGHARLLENALAALGVPLLGCLPRADDLVLPSRHLGLVQAVERDDLEQFLDRAGAFVGAHLDIDTIAALARAPEFAAAPPTAPSIPPLGRRIAVARDRAFGFIYDGILDGWRAEGAELELFSPLSGEAPSPAANAIYLPGGYPELHAGQIASNESLMAALRRVADAGGVVYGECGGYMVLGRGLVDGDGVRHQMAGLLPLETSFENPRLHLGYRALRLLADGPLGVAGGRYRGHEFHYASMVSEPAGEALFHASNAVDEDLGAVGQRSGGVIGSFLHLIDRVN